MSAFNGFQANPADIQRFEQDAATVAGQIPGLPNRYSTLHLDETPFGGTDFPAAARLIKAYGLLMNQMTENVKDLADQATDFGNGAGNAASGYTQTAQTEVNTVNQFAGSSKLTGG